MSGRWGQDLPGSADGGTMDPRDPTAGLGSVRPMLRRAPGRRGARILRRRPWHPSTEDVLTTVAAALVGGAVAVPLVGWRMTASPSSWAVLVALSIGLGAGVASLRTFWSDERVASRAARRRAATVVTVPTCARWARRTQHRSCRHATARAGAPSLHPRTLARHSGRAGRPTASARAHRPHV